MSIAHHYRYGVFPQATFTAYLLVFLGFYVIFIGGLIFATILYISPEKFLAAIKSEEVLFSVKLSLLTASTTTFISILLALPAAYGLSKYNYPAKSFIDTILDLPLVLPPTSVGVILLVFFLSAIGQEIQQHTMQFAMRPQGILLAQFTVVCGFAVRVLKSAFDAINPRYEQVARTLGYSPWRSFFGISVPLARSGILAATTLTWAKAMGEFGATFILVGATPFKTEVMPIAMWLFLGRCEIQEALAVALLLIFIAFLVLITLKRLIGGVSIVGR